MRPKNKIYNLPNLLQLKKLKDCSIQQLMKIIILPAQFLGIFPVYGITKDAKNLTFRWVSLKTIFAVFTIILQAIYTYVTFATCNIDIHNFFSFVVIIWNVRTLLGVIFFFKVAYRWPKLLQQWTEMENGMLCYGPIPSLRRRFQIMPLIFLATGIFEHASFVYGGIKKALSIMKEDDNFLKVYFETLYVEFFTVVEYSHWKALYLAFLSLMSTFLWSFCDLFIILLSSALAERFRQINKKIETKVVYELQWMVLRQQYSKLLFLCKTLNDAIGEIVLLSYIDNVCFLSVFIFQSFTSRSPFEAFYFWYDMLFKFAHLFLVGFYATWVHEESKKPKFAIFSVVVENMHYEVNRFLYQIVNDDAAIYGAGLFKITRSTILQVPSDTGLPFQLKRKQIPIRLAFGITINKAQGQSFKKLGIYLSEPTFSHGQLYVAFYRVAKISNVKIKTENTNEKVQCEGKDGTFTKNIVYNEILD